jgi:hypothetical protein
VDDLRSAEVAAEEGQRVEEQRSGGARCSMLTLRQTESSTDVSCERERLRSREQRKPGGPRSRAEKFDGRTAAAEGSAFGSAQAARRRRARCKLTRQPPRTEEDMSGCEKQRWG